MNMNAHLLHLKKITQKSQSNLMKLKFVRSDALFPNLFQFDLVQVENNLLEVKL